MMKPVGVVNVGEPLGVVDHRETHVLHFAERFPHYVDVVDVQELELCIGVDVLIFVSASRFYKLEDSKEHM